MEPGLQIGQFIQIAKQGFGDSANSYPHAMVWFNDYLYVGTTRHVLVLVYKRSEEFKSWQSFPVRCPQDVHRVFDTRGQIWRYHFQTEKWEKVLTSPMVIGKNGEKLPAYQGFRNMIVFQGKSDKNPCIYAHTWSPKDGIGPLLLRSTDGIHFEQLEIKGFVGTFSTFRPLVSFKGKLFTSPSGKTEGASKISIVLENDDPIKKAWKQVNEPDFGEPHNLSISELGVFNDHLYAGTVNPEGFQLWKTDVEGKPPYKWKKVLDKGAGRGSLNEVVASMCAFGDALYIGTAISNGGYDLEYSIGPAPSELIRVYPDDSWELIVGDGRIINGELKMPLSGFGPGFDNPFNTYFWRLCVHEGWLYLGTFNCTVMVPYPSREKWSKEKQEMFDKDRMEQLIDKHGGFELWRSRDGVFWIPVTRNGFGNFYNYGVRTLISTPYGLIVGAANPFGPDIAVERASGWVYEPNPKGGLEIWVGSENFHKKNTHISNKLLSCDDKIEFCKKIIEEYYQKSKFREIGYWRENIESSKQACENLLEELLSFLPDKKGNILDLGCGYGGSTEYLLKYYSPENISGICFEKEEIDIAKESLSGIKFIRALIPRIKKPDNYFDTVINIEKLSKYSWSLKWIEEVFRVLKPGGYFLCSEILSNNSKSPWRKNKTPITTIEEFKNFLFDVGFEKVNIFDITISWKFFYKNVSLFLWEKLLRNEIDQDMMEEIQDILYGDYMPVCSYLICVIRKTDKF